MTLVEGGLALSQMILSPQAPPKTARVVLGNTPVDARFQIDGDQVRIALATPLVLKPGDILTVVLA